MFKGFYRATFYLQKFTYTVDRGKKRSLNRVAALVRASCIRTLRISQQTSPPGSPPFAKTRGGLRVIEYVTFQDTAIVGPVKFPGSDFFNQPVPHIHEFGGTFFSKRAYFNYPERSYMGHTLNQLIARGAIPREVKVGMGHYFNF